MKGKFAIIEYIMQIILHNQRTKILIMQIDLLKNFSFTRQKIVLISK